MAMSNIQRLEAKVKYKINLMIIILKLLLDDRKVELTRSVPLLMKIFLYINKSYYLLKYI